MNEKAIVIDNYLLFVAMWLTNKEGRCSPWVYAHTDDTYGNALVDI